MTQKVFLVDDDKNILISIRMALETEGFFVKTFSDPEEGLKNFSGVKKAKAILNNQTTPNIEDIQSMIHPVLRHRIIPNFNAEADGVSRDDILNKLIDENKC